MVDFLQYIFVKRGFVTPLVGQEKVLSFAVNVKYDVGSTSGFWVSFGGPSARFSTLASRRVPGFSNAKNRKVGQLKSPMAVQEKVGQSLAEHLLKKQFA